MLSIILGCVLSLSNVPADGQDLIIVQNGQTNWAIALPADATAPVRHGAEELQKHLELMSGARLPIVEASAAKPASAIKLCLDQTIGAEAFRIRTVPGGIEIRGDDRRGLLYGCYGLLEDVLGCRWYTAKIHKIPRGIDDWRGPNRHHPETGVRVPRTFLLGGLRPRLGGPQSRQRQFATAR